MTVTNSPLSSTVTTLQNIAFEKLCN